MTDSFLSLLNVAILCPFSIRCDLSPLPLAQHVIGCINHDIVIKLRFKKLIRSSNYSNIGYGKDLSSHIVIEPGSFRT